MNTLRTQRGFTIIEVLMASAVFAFVMIGVTQLYSNSLELQRRATGYQKIQENALFVLESIAREVRVSTITSGNTDCNPPDISTRTITLEHPVNGTVTYTYERVSDVGIITRISDIKGGSAEPITSSDVDVTNFAFCVSGSGVDQEQIRVTMPITLQASAGKPGDVVSVSLQSTIVSRDLTEELISN